MERYRSIIFFILLLPVSYVRAVNLPSESYKSSGAVGVASYNIGIRSKIDMRFMSDGLSQSECSSCDNMGKDDAYFDCWVCCVGTCGYIDGTSEQKDCSRRCQGISLPLSGGEWFLLLLLIVYVLKMYYKNCI